MEIKDFNEKKICLLGWGIENQAFLKYLAGNRIRAGITICDRRHIQGAKKGLAEFLSPFELNFRSGRDYNKNLADYDYILRVAGYPLHEAEIKKALSSDNTVVTSPTKLFFDLCPSKNIIGVTGTKGKGTVSGLIHKILASAGFNVFWAGNIGIALFSVIDKVKPDDWVVLELSSFQLEDLQKSPHIGIITNLAREHLKPADKNNPNYHKSYDGYIEAKLNLIRHQAKKDWAVINEKLKDTLSVKGRKGRRLGKGKKVYFGNSHYESRLFGEFNKENIAAAAKTANIIGIKEGIIKKGIKNFRPLPHRLQYLGEISGRKCFDNSIATTPEATIADLESFFDPVVLLLGGADKGANFRALARKIKEKKVKQIILFKGKGSLRILSALKKADYPRQNIKTAKNMKEATDIAFEKSEAGDVILLSPAAASFGLFKNYKDRGDQFKQALKR